MCLRIKVMILFYIMPETLPVDERGMVAIVATVIWD